MSDGIAQAKGIVSVRGGGAAAVVLLLVSRTSSTAISGAADCGKVSLVILRNRRLRLEFPVGIVW